METNAPKNNFQYFTFSKKQLAEINKEPAAITTEPSMGSSVPIKNNATPIQYKILFLLLVNIPFAFN